MSQAPTISVLLPVRGDGAFLTQAIDSLCAQSFTAWEALVCAIDGVLLPTFDDPRVRVTQADAETAAGVLATTAGYAQGSFLCVLDGDDQLEPQAFTTLLAAFDAQPAAGMAYSRHVLIDTTGNVIAPGPLCELPYSPQALLLDFMTGPLQLIRREAYQTAGGFDQKYVDAADYDLCLRLSEACNIVHVPLPLYRKRMHPNTPALVRWVEHIEDRYRAFATAVQRRGLDAHYDCALEIDSWHILQPLRPFGGAGNWR